MPELPPAKRVCALAGLDEVRYLLQASSVDWSSLAVVLSQLSLPKLLAADLADKLLQDSSMSADMVLCALALLKDASRPISSALFSKFASTREGDLFTISVLESSARCEHDTGILVARLAENPDSESAELLAATVRASAPAREKLQEMTGLLEALGRRLLAEKSVFLFRALIDLSNGSARACDGLSREGRVLEACGESMRGEGEEEGEGEGESSREGEGSREGEKEEELCLLGLALAVNLVEQSSRARQLAILMGLHRSAWRVLQTHNLSLQPSSTCAALLLGWMCFQTDSLSQFIAESIGMQPLIELLREAVPGQTDDLVAHLVACHNCS